jgi:hypothetical protein
LLSQPARNIVAIAIKFKTGSHLLCISNDRQTGTFLFWYTSLYYLYNKKAVSPESIVTGNQTSRQMMLSCNSTGRKTKNGLVHYFLVLL